MIVIDVSLSNIYIAEVKGKGKQAKVLQHFTIPIPVGEVFREDNLDEKGFFQLVQATIEGIRDEEVSITFSYLPVIYNTHEVPFVKNAAQQAQAIESRLYSTLSAKEFIVYYRVAGKSTATDGKSLLIQSYAVHRLIAESAYRVIERLGKRPVALYIGEDLMAGFAETYLPETKLLIASINQRQITLHLINKPEIITNAVGVELNKKLNFSTQVTWQISNMLQYQSIKYNGTNIEQIYLCGDHVTDEIRQRLETDFSMPVRMLSDAVVMQDDVNLDQFVYALSCNL
jgi:hypothetical protein